MHLRKCDICHKDLQSDSSIRVEVGYSRGKDFCLKCGKPILDFLKKHKLIDKTEK